MLVIDGLGDQGDSKYDDARDKEEDHPKVEIVHSTDDFRAVTRVHAASCPIDKLCNHP